MKIRFGLSLDGERGGKPADALNDIAVGPAGLLDILETQLGLLRAETPHAQRVLQYRDCLRRRDNVDRFYHASFRTDELGTAATLLSWRDQWHLHGWNRSLAAADSARLMDMQAVESEALKTLAPSVGERLGQIAQRMATRRPAIQSIELAEPIDSHPTRWRDVLRNLGARPSQALATPAASGMLGQIQAAMIAISRGELPAKLRWHGDGSVRVVQAETRLLASRWLAAELACDHGDTLVVAEDGAILDDILASAQQPRQGFRETTAFRPALQVVPLALAQLWQPLDVYGLLKFLTHPICPVPAVARSRLAEMLARSPGIGAGTPWATALTAIEAACQDKGYDWSAVRESIERWVEHARHETAEGAPIEAVRECLQALVEYFRGRLSDTDPVKHVAFQGGFSQARSCLQSLNALAEQGEQRIGPQQLQTLVIQATAQGSVNPLLGAEVGACRTVSDPGAVIEPADRVIWWQLAAPQFPSPYPWSLSEQAALKAAGVSLPELEVELNFQARSWQRVVLQARQTLVLVLPPPGNEVHPLWLMLDALFDQDHRPVVESLETILRGIGTGLETQPDRPLPVRRREWQLPDGVSIPSRDKESYSSLESFLFNPYLWVLGYPAKLEPSSILDVSSDFLLYGNLAHNLVERYYRQPGALQNNEDELLAWFGPAFEAIVATEGAVLLMPGRRENLEDLRRRLRLAMVRLRQHLSDAGAVTVEPELALEGRFPGGRFGGFADLVVTRKDGLKAVVDMKWAGGKKYPEKLASNRHLQLAVYGELLRQQTGQWPSLAYFILNEAKLIATSPDFFPNARLIWKKKEVGDEGTAHLWQRFLKTWAWRREQLDDGRIEVALEEDPESDAPEDGMALEILNPAYNDYLALAGWGEQQ